MLNAAVTIRRYEGFVESEREYLQRRESEEQQAADRAENDKVRDLHRDFAARYRDAAASKPVRRNDEPELVNGLPMELHIIE